MLLENHVRALYRLLNHGEEFTDLRCINVNGPKSELLDRSIVQGEEAVVRWARSWNGKGNCFIGRNPRNQDGTVSRITTFSLDLDPIRPKGTASTDEGHQAALVAGRLALQESPAGYLASSGNGALVVYRLAVPIDKNFKTFESWLASREDHLQRLFSDRGLNVKADHVHDSARIIKLPGTTSTKGDRAHWRVSKFIDLPSAPYRCHAFDIGISEPDTEGLEADAARAEAMDIRGAAQGSGPATALARDGAGRTVSMPVGTLDERIQVAARALARLAPERREDYQKWLNVGMSLTELGLVGLQLWDTWSRGSKKYEEGICEQKWKTFKASLTEKKFCTIGSLLHWADADSPSSAGDGGDTRPEDPPQSVADWASEYIEHLQAAAESGGKLELPMGFAALDDRTGGLRRGDFLVVGARTKLGKTSFACLVAARAAAAGKRVAYFCTEMGKKQILSRIIGSYCGIPSRAMERGQLAATDYGPVTNFLSGPGRNLYIDEKSSVDVQYIIKRSAQFKPDIVIFDHIQRAGTDADRMRGQISGFVKGFKNFLKDTNTAGLMLSQLKRLGKDTKGRTFEPQISDLKESGTIEEEAGAIVLLHWLGDNPQDTHATVVANLAANRHGPTDYLELRFEKALQRFEEAPPK